MSADKQREQLAQLDEIAAKNAAGAKDTPAIYDPHLQSQSGECISFGRNRGWRRRTAYLGMPSRNVPHASDQAPHLADELKERGK